MCKYVMDITTLSLSPYPSDQCARDYSGGAGHQAHRGNFSAHLRHGNYLCMPVQPKSSAKPSAQSVDMGQVVFRTIIETF